MTARKHAIAQRFGRAAPGYERAAGVQRVAASSLARRILAAGLPPRPRILEIGCGTGMLTACLHEKIPHADWTVTDLSGAMVRHCRDRFAGTGAMRFLAMDAETPALRCGFDLICGGLAMQWLEDREVALAGLACLLHDGGLLALSTLGAASFSRWRTALGDEVADTMPAHPSLEQLQAAWPASGAGLWRHETILDRHPSGIDFLRGLRAIGADLPGPGAKSLDPLALRRVLRRFQSEHDSVADYQIAYGLFRRASRRGVFVTGTDTGIGKTVVSACLARAWGATYWKPLQTGLADDLGDTGTVVELAGLTPDRVLPPIYTLDAPLSPEAAAQAQGVVINPDSIVLPPGSDVPLVVEGAGGLMVPIAGGVLMIDLIARLGLPVVLVARGTLGTINHTLLSLEALRSRGIVVAGVVLNRGSTQSNRAAIEQHGAVRVLAELPEVGTLDAQAIAGLASLMPALAACTRR